MHSGNDINRWTVSLADFMTLMFAVFVVLYAVSSSKEEKYKDVIQSIRGASKLLNSAVIIPESQGLLIKESNHILEEKGPALLSDQKQNQDHGGGAEKKVSQADDALSEVDTLKTGKALAKLQIDLEKALAAELNEKSIGLDLNGDWLTIEMGGNLLFIGGSHTLLSSAKQQLIKLAKTLMPVNNMLRIRGYTDQESISNEIYFSNWELAGARAFAVLHELNTLGIAGKRMVMEAYGQYSPVIDQAGSIDKIKSRRVVIAISKYALVEDKQVAGKPLLINKKLTNKKDNGPEADLPKPDRDEMHELHLPNNRLIITTRQE